MALFKSGEFKSHSGLVLPFKIDCDVLSNEDIETIAHIISRHIQPFSNVYGIPEGGVRLATALLRCRSTKGGVLIADDVFTTGKSMEEARRAFGNKSNGVVIFARRKCPEWITPFLQLSSCFGP